MKENEMTFLAMVALGMFSVDKKGRVWRHAKMSGGSRLGVTDNIVILAKKRRAETSRSTYPTILFRVGAKRFKVYAHRIVWMLNNRRLIPERMEINHKDGNKDNHQPRNLELVTRRQNTLHSFRELPRKTKAQWGADNASAKLTLPEAQEVLSLKGVMSQATIAEQYGITQSAVSAIHVGKSWPQLTR